jgi:hypothetical protein
MIKRIVDRKPDLSRSSWTESWSKNLSYLDNISKFDLEWHESKVKRIYFYFHFFFTFFLLISRVVVKFIVDNYHQNVQQFVHEKAEKVQELLLYQMKQK